jgi:hypothetical protein
LEYGSKLVVSVIPGGRATAIYDMGLLKYAAEADDQAATKGELINRLIRVDATAVKVVIVIGAACRGDRRKVLGFELDTYPWGNVDICPQLESCGKIAVGRISRSGGQDIGSQQEPYKGPHRRVGYITGPDRPGHNIILVEVAAGYLSASVKIIIIDAGARRDMIIKYFYPHVTVDIEIDRAAQVQTAGNTAIRIIKVISGRKGVAYLRNQLNGGLSKSLDRRQEDNR